MKLFVATLKRMSDITCNSGWSRKHWRLQGSYACASGCKRGGQTYRLPVPLLFFLFITRLEHSLYYPARWKKLAVPLYLSSRPFAKNGSKMRYRVIVKRHVARFAAARLFDVDKVSRDFLRRSTFPLPVPRRRSVVVVAEIPRNPRYWSSGGFDTDETNGKGEWNPDGISSLVPDLKTRRVNGETFHSPAHFATR